MKFQVAVLTTALQPLIGLQIVHIYHAGDMCGFVFASPVPTIDESPQVEWFLHISCAWRLEQGEELVTGTYDWLQHATTDELLREEWDPAHGGSLQESILRSLLKDLPGSDRTIRNHTSLLCVVGVVADCLGGLIVEFDEGYRLVAFPSSTRKEYWRIFPSKPESSYLVVEGNGVSIGSSGPDLETGRWGS